MGTFSKAKNVIASAGKATIDGLQHAQTALASLTPDQVKEIEKNKENYYSRLIWQKCILNYQHLHSGKLTLL